MEQDQDQDQAGIAYQKSAVPYARASGKGKDTGSSTIEKQLEQISAIALARNIQCCRPIIDNGVSGSTPLFRRAGGQTLREVCEQGCKIILVAHTDRLFRDVADSIQVAGWILENGIQVIAGNEELDFSSPEGEFMLILRVALAQLERRRTGQRILETNKHKRGRGERLTGQIPFGFEEYDTGRIKENGKPVKGIRENKEEMETVRIIRRAWKNGDGSRLIARVLNALGKLNRGGRPWGHTSVAAIARRQA